MIEPELIIIGGGAAGLSAAAWAAEHGHNATVLEANPRLGGNGIFAEVIFGLNTREQEKRGVVCDIDRWFRLAMEYSHWKNDPRLTRRLLEKCGENVDWLCDHGLQLAGMEPESVPGLGAATHFTEGMHTGRDAMAVLRAYCESSDRIKIYTRTRATALLTDEGGAVVGAKAETADGPVTLRGGAVLIASGGMGGDRELMARVIPAVDPDAFAHVRGIRMRGDGARLAEAAGAELMADGCLENAGPTFAGSQELMGLVTKRYAVWLSCRGRRFADESVGDNFVFGCNAVYRQPGHFCYVLLDGAMVEDAAAGPVDFLAGPTANARGFAGLSEALRRETEKGNAIVSPELDGVAAWMGVPAETLRGEIETYNACCEAGRDPIFLKPAPLLRPLTRGDYVCIRCGVDYILTHGGIRVDEDMRVLRPDGAPVPGLYAAGVDISGVDAGGYQVSMGGHSFGFSTTGGRVAAESAYRGGFWNR